MSELTLVILRIGFLIMLWSFIFAIVYALRSDLFGAPVRRMKGRGTQSGQGVAIVAQDGGQQQAQQPAPQPAQQYSAQPSAFPIVTPSGETLPSAGQGGAARQLVITEGVATGTSIPLDEDLVTIGRSGDSTLVIVDEYTSTYHAKLTRTGDRWTLTDLDSTNGTKLAGQRVTSSVALPTFTQVTIGKTSFELRP